MSKKNEGFSQQNAVEQRMWHKDYNDTDLFQVDGLGLQHGNDAGFQTRLRTTVTYKPEDGFKQPETGGIKHDSGKPDLSHISLTLMEEVARVREFGAKKYSRGNWLKGFKYTRSIAAALRHIFAFSSGEDLDPESGLSHISHAICCLEHLLNDIKNHKHNDDRK